MNSKSSQITISYLSKDKYFVILIIVIKGNLILPIKIWQEILLNS